MSSSAQLANAQLSLGPKPEAISPDAAPLSKRLRYYLNPVDGRYEDLRKDNLGLNILRDFTAGLIVAMVAIPLAMGFAMACGLRPEQGIVGGAIAGLIGAISPLAGVFKCFLKLGLALYLASYLELVPMACIGGILLYVATAMVKPAEVKQVLAHNRFHMGLMVYTAVMVVVTDFLTGVLSAVILWGLLHRLLDKPVPAAEQALAQS